MKHRNHPGPDCPKCDKGELTKLRYVSKKEFYPPVGRGFTADIKIIPEHLLRSCTICGYSIKEPCKDTK